MLGKIILTQKLHLLAMLVLGVPVFSGYAEPFNFALIGDMPYGVGAGMHYPAMTELIDDIDQQAIQFVVHVGDIKSGSAKCSNLLFQDRLKRFNQFNTPLILLLGDNDWTDCHRRGDDPLERLRYVRELFYTNPTQSLGQSSWPLEHQARYVEHQRWRYQQIQFVTLHLVGSRNGGLPFKGRTPAHDAEVVSRTTAALKWLKLAFEKAHTEQALGMVVILHANPGLNSPKLNSHLKSKRKASGPVMSRRGFETFLSVLDEEVANFPNPVLLVHGDSHVYRVDQPILVDKKRTNLTRVEVFGVTADHWVQVIVDSERRELFNISAKQVGVKDMR